ncbi:MAG: ABC transporter substrate-binding protein [Limnochordia bacterium]
MKRLMSLTMVVVLLVSLAAGLAAAEEDVIVVMGSSTFDPSTPAGAYLQEVTRLFMEQNPGIRVELNWGSWGDLWNKVGIMLSNRQGPDLLVGPREYLMAPGRGAGQWDDILIVPEDKFLSPIQRQALGPAVLEATRFPGRGYMVWPWTLYVDGTMVVNGDMLRKAGYDPYQIQDNGWTIDQFVEIARAVTKDTDGDGKVDQWAAYFGPVTGGHNGERIAHTGIFTHNIPYRLRGHNVWTATFVDIKTGDLFLDEEAFLKGWRLIREMIDEGLIPRQSVGVAMDESREAFIHGMTAYSFDGPDLLNLVYERNNRIERGLEQGEPFEPVVVPRPRFAGSDWVDFPITVIAHGFYSFKQEPYKGDQHTENVFKFAKFLTDPVFQVTLAHRQSIPPDMRVYYGEHAWFPGILGNDRNAQFIEEIPQYWKPQMGIYIQMAITDELSQALQKYEMEIVRPTREAVFLGNMTPEEGVAKLREELDKIDKAIPKERRLSPDAPAIAKDFDDFAKSIGQKY